jgi:ATP-NAD kinase N-terminal domain
MSKKDSHDSGILGIIVNPHSGRDARRLFARAGTSTIDDKRNQVTRIVVGAAAAGCRKVLLSKDGFRITSSAVDALRLPIECEILDLETTGHGIDSQRAAIAMRDAGCSALVALGGDGTSRAISQAWPDVTLLPLSTGTNNVFPFEVEATIAGAAAGLVASGRLSREEAGARTKIVRVRLAEGRESMALIDAALLVDDHLGSLLQVDPSKLAAVLLTRAEPASVGLSPVGGLVLPCGAGDDFGVEVRTRPGPDPASTGKCLRAPISPGLYETVGIDSVERIEFETPIEWRGPGILAFDGDREIELRVGESAKLWIAREGPWVIQPERALRAATARGAFLDMGDWHDHRSVGHKRETGTGGSGCC